MKRLSPVIFVMVMLGMTLPAEAKEFPQVYIFDAMKKASERWQISFSLVRAVAEVESGLHPWAVNVGGKSFHPKEHQDAYRLAREGLTAGKSVDIGLMQINNFWIKKWGLSLEAVFDPEVNLLIGSWILAQELKRYGNNWMGVGSYHTPVKRYRERARQYAERVYEMMARR